MFEFILGFFVGLMSSISGIGGGPFIVLGLTYIGYSQHTAQGTGLALILAPITLFSVVHLWKEVLKYKKFILTVILFYSISSYFGAYIAFMLANEGLKYFFSVLIILIGIYNILKKDINCTNPQILNCYVAIFIGLISGLLGGLFGIGAGIIIVPFLYNLYKLKRNEVRAISLAVLLPPVSLGAVVLYNEHNNVLWPIVLIIFIGYLIGNFFGSRIGTTINDKSFNMILGIILIASGIINIIF